MSTHKPPHLDLLNNQSNNENIPTTSLIGGESSSVAGKHHSYSYKTLLCHQWLTNGTCPRGPECDYAHGTSEIRQRAGEGSGTLYKREMCKFWMTGKCAHGNMCNYAHGQTELRESNLQLTQKPPMAQQPLTPATSSMVGGRAPYFSFHSPPTPKLMPQQLHHYHQNIVANKIPPLSSSAPHFLMSNPPPPQPLTPLWGQMPIQSSPTVLNTLLLTPGHFQPLTGGGIHLRSLPAPPHFPPPPHSSPAYSHHHHHPLPIAAAAANQSQPPHQLFANVNASVPHNNQQMMPSQPPPMMMMPRPAHTQSPMTMAELAMQFEIMNMPNPPIAPAKDPDFDANNEVDFPTLESTVKKGPKTEKPLERAIAVEQKSFANIAAKPPEAIIAKHNKQPLPPPPQKLMPAQPVPAVVNRAVTRPNKTAVEKQMSIPEEEEEADEAAEAAFLTNNHHLLLVPMPISPPPGFPKKFATSSPPQLLEQSSSSNEDSYSNDNNNILWGIDDNDEPPTAEEEEEDTTAPMQMQSHLEDLWNQDPYLSHVMQTEAEMIKSIERKEEEPQENGVSCEWSTVVSRRRKSSLNAEHLAHRPSPCTDDGYQEDYSDNDDVDGNNGGGQRTIESPASSIAQQGEANGGSSGSRNHLDKSHVFYRTHICNFWQAWRDKKGPPCKHGAGCFYAHGPSKLIELNRKYYKTVLCDTYNSGKDCPFGRSCNFAHGEKELRRFNEAPNANTKEQKKFYTVPKRHQMRKQRGTQTIQCIPTAAKHFDKVTVVKAGESSSANNKK